MSLLREVRNEVKRARKKHPDNPSFHHWRSVIQEEVNEFWDEVQVDDHKLSPLGQEERIKKIRKELIQVAATAIRTIEDLIDIKPVEQPPIEWP